MPTVNTPGFEVSAGWSAPSRHVTFSACSSPERNASFLKSGLNLITGKPFEFVLLKFYPGLVTYPAIGIFCGVSAWYMNRAVRKYKGI